jgi:hypothetical protein
MLLARSACWTGALVSSAEISTATVARALPLYSIELFLPGGFV